MKTEKTEEKSERRKPDRELSMISRVMKILDEADPQEAERVMHYVETRLRAKLYQSHLKSIASALPKATGAPTRIYPSADMELEKTRAAA